MSTIIPSGLTKNLTISRRDRRARGLHKRKEESSDLRSREKDLISRKEDNSSVSAMKAWR
jgi:hypothetical protein